VSSILNLEEPTEWPTPNHTLTDLRPIMRSWEQGLPVTNAAEFYHAIRLLSRALQLY
jgi:hypothetical protein